MDIQELSEKVRQQSAFCMNLLREVEGTVIGQKALVESILTGILADGHVLLEGLPGLAKTTAVKAFADAVSLDFKRIQFTPDLLPADLLGTTIYNAKEAKFETRKGPLFTNLVLADEINRAPSKVQSALLEAMQERHITIGDETFKLDEPFLVLATQNPVDFVGTYPLPEAQMDRFFMRISIGYPTVEDEMDILARYCGASAPMQTLSAVCSAEDVLSMQQQVKSTYASPEVRAYVAAICAATRNTPYLTLGASTRAAIALVRAAQGNALLCGRDYIIPEDVQRMAAPVLCHRFVLSADARMRGYTEQQVLLELMRDVRIPVRHK